MSRFGPVHLGLSQGCYPIAVLPLYHVIIFPNIFQFATAIAKEVDDDRKKTFSTSGIQTEPSFFTLDDSLSSSSEDEEVNDSENHHSGLENEGRDSFTIENSKVSSRFPGFFTTENN